MELNMLKCHGSNNDFIIIDEMDGILFTDTERSEMAIMLCHRETGIGADGILFILASHTQTAKMRVFNADGTEASMCGNGLRCVARYVCEKLAINQAVIETMKANLQVSRRESIFGHIPTYQVEISPVSFQLSDLPLDLDRKELINEPIEILSEIPFTALAVPNPHIIAIVEQNVIESSVQETISLKVNGPNQFFPDGVNVSFVQLLSKGNIFVRTFERGVGFTNACGTAMSASTLVTCLLGLNDWDQPVEVYNPGGKVRCVAHKGLGSERGLSIDLIGNATYTDQFTVNLERANRTFAILSQTHMTSEMEQYEELATYAKKIVAAASQN